MTFLSFGELEGFRYKLKIIPGLGVIGLDGECLVVAGLSLIQLPQVLERIAKVVVRLGVIGLDGERLVKAGNGLVRFAKVLERIAEVVVRLR